MLAWDVVSLKLFGQVLSHVYKLSFVKWKIMELDCTVGWFKWVKRLSGAYVLVIVHIMFSISLLDVGSPYMGHLFQVQVLCHLQWRCLGGLRLSDSLCCFCCITCISSQGLICVELVLSFCNQVLTWKDVSLQGILLILWTFVINTRCTFVILTLMFVWQCKLSIMFMEGSDVGIMYYFEGFTLQPPQ